MHLRLANQKHQHQTPNNADLTDVVAAWAQGTPFFDIYKMMEVFEVRPFFTSHHACMAAQLGDVGRRVAHRSC